MRHAFHHGWMMVLALVAAMSLAGCATSSTLTTAPDTAPADFTVDLTILADQAIAGRIGAEYHPARYVVLPDGTLHAHLGPVERRLGEAPALVRTLHHHEVDALWRLVRELGLTDPEQVDAAGNLDLVETQPNQITYLTSIVAEGDRLNFGRALSGSEPGDLRFTRLARTLAGLAWVSDEPPLESARRIPRRYDFGPDPYARYRNQPAGGGGSR